MKTRSLQNHSETKEKRRTREKKQQRRKKKLKKEKYITKPVTNFIRASVFVCIVFCFGIFCWPRMVNEVEIL